MLSIIYTVAPVNQKKETMIWSCQFKYLIGYFYIYLAIAYQTYVTCVLRGLATPDDCQIWTNYTFILIYIVLINQSLIKNKPCDTFYEVIIFFSIIKIFVLYNKIE